MAEDTHDGNVFDTPVTEAEEPSVPPGSLVVGLDGSSAARQALAWAVAEATRRDLPLHLLCARETYIGAAQLDSSVAWTDPTLDALDDSSTVIDDARRYVHELTPQVHLTFSRPWGRPAQHLVEASRDACMVVVGNRGQGSLTSAVLGTVSLQTAVHARCPVVVVREDQTPHPAGSLKVTVGVDGSHDAAEAVRFAMDVAGPGGAVDFVLAWWLEVVDGTVVTTPGTPGWEAVEAKYRAILDRALGDLPRQNPQVRIERHIARGRTEDVLLAATADSDLLVVGSRGRGGFAGLLLGSVSQHVLASSPCPVAVMVNRRGDGHKR